MLLALLATQAGPIAPPVEQLRAECVHPTYATDMLVCAEGALMAKDAEMAALLASAGTIATAGAQPMLEPQAVWFRRRSLCAANSDHLACASAAYDERIAVLKALTIPIGSGQPLTCRPSWRREPVLGWMTDQGSLVLRDGARVMGVAVMSSKGTGWQPFAAMTNGSKSSVRIETADGATLRCRKTPA